MKEDHFLGEELFEPPRCFYWVATERGKVSNLRRSTSHIWENVDKYRNLPDDVCHLSCCIVGSSDIIDFQWLVFGFQHERFQHERWVQPSVGTHYMYTNMDTLYMYLV